MNILDNVSSKLSDVINDLDAELDGQDPESAALRSILDDAEALQHKVLNLQTKWEEEDEEYRSQR